MEFDYNAAGQPTAIDRYNEYDGLEVVAGTLVAGTTYDYDLAGRLKELVNTPDVAAAVTHSCNQWDYRNRLVSVAFDGPYASSDFTITFEYDVFNRRTSRVPEYDAPPSYVFDNAPQYYIYDGDNVVIDFGDVDGPSTTPSLGVARKYLFGPAVDQVLAVEGMTQQIYAADRVLWLLGDHQNTTRDIVDNAGALEGRTRGRTRGTFYFIEKVECPPFFPLSSPKFGCTGCVLTRSDGVVRYFDRPAVIVSPHSHRLLTSICGRLSWVKCLYRGLVKVPSRVRLTMA
ncbi:MAG: hypothetical protein WD063_19635 [Pirellulales bacterium]